MSNLTAMALDGNDMLYFSTMPGTRSMRIFKFRPPPIISRADIARVPTLGAPALALMGLMGLMLGGVFAITHRRAS